MHKFIRDVANILSAPPFTTIAAIVVFFAAVLYLM